MLKLPLEVKQIAGRWEAVQGNGERLMALTQKEAQWLTKGLIYMANP